ncbi:Uncharacterized protein Rs2_03810 [Raphanus sativus]|nr:Uncharacterized protein Rs2_03810 [Raphanus sativus]
MANSYTVLANLRAGRCSNKVEVRLLRFWDAKNIKGGKLISLEMLLIDEEYLRFLSPYVYCLSGRTPTSPGAISVFVCPMPMFPFASMMARLSLKEPIQLSQYQLKCSGIIRAIVIFKYLDESLMFYQFMNGTGRHVGIRVDYSAASWDRAYIVDSANYLTKPFFSMYFGVAYLLWLSEYERRERSNQFIVEAYIKGLDHVDLEASSCPLWLKFEQALSSMENPSGS